MRPNRKNQIIAAAIREVAHRGVIGSTIRRIAAEAGVTEGAIYRHFESKEALCLEAYSRIVGEMAEQKRTIVEGEARTTDKLTAWVRVTYEYFDRYREAFVYVLLTPHDFPPETQEITTRQGRLFTRLMEKAVETGEMLDIPTHLARSHFAGIMLNVPRSIHESILEGPAVQYVDDVMRAIICIFRLASPNEAAKPELNTSGN